MLSQYYCRRPSSIQPAGAAARLLFFVTQPQIIVNQPILLLDVMETLVQEPFFEAMPGHFGMTLDQLLELKHPTAWVEFEKGKISEEEYVANFFRDGRKVDATDLRRFLWDFYDWTTGMHKLVRELHQRGFEMHALSNYPVWSEIIEEKLRLSRYLQWTFVSWRTGLRKPAREAFLNAAETLGVGPGQCLFIDDRPVNVEAARQVGMDAVLMKSADQLRRELSKRKLIEL